MLLALLWLTSLSASAAPLLVSVAASGKYLLWNNSDGNGAVCLAINTSGTYSYYTYGPYPNWSAKALAVGADGLARLLWTKTDGSAALWRVDASGGFTQTTYGPFSGWTARSLAVGANNVPRIMWTYTDGTMSLWSVDTQGGYTYQNFGPYTGYTASLIAVGANNVPRILWNKSDGSISLWNGLSGTAGYLHAEYGPFAGYAPLSLTADSGNAVRLLWNHPADSTTSLWNMPLSGGYTFQNYTNPAVNSPVAVSTDLSASAGYAQLLYGQADGTARISFLNGTTQVSASTVAPPGASTGGGGGGTGSSTPSYGHYTVSYSGGTITTQDASGTHTVNPTTYSSTYSDSAELAGQATVSPTTSLSAKMQGPLTANFTWVPDAAYPNSPPPAQVSVTETLSFNWGVSDYNSRISGSYNTDLGQSGSIPANTYSSAGGTKTFSTAGLSSFSVSCNPSASFSGSVSYHELYDETLGFKFTAAASFANPGTINLNGTPAPNSTQIALTGQPIMATLSLPSDLPAGTKITSYTWSFDGGTGSNPIKNWDPNGKAPDGTLQQLFSFMPADLTRTDTTGNGIPVNSVNSIVFYDQTNDKITVKCAVNLKLPDGTTKTINPQSVPIAFLKPSANLTASKTDVVDDPTNNRFGGAELWVIPPMDVPLPFSGGTGSLCQIVTPTRSITRVPKNGKATATYYNKVQLSPGSVFWVQQGTGLDGYFPYQYEFQANGTPLYHQYGYEWDVTTTGIAADDPYQSYTTDDLDGGGTDWRTSTATDSFKTWLMYKPNYTNAIWVPLQEIDWSWTGTATKNTSTGVWSTVGSVTTPAKATDTTILPSWIAVDQAIDKLHW